MRQDDSFVREARDIHSDRPEYGFRVKVGFSKLVVPVKIGGREAIGCLELFVTLPEWRRGADLSRLVEAAYTYMRKLPPEESLAKMAEEILHRMRYAERAEVKLSFIDLKEEEAYEPYKVTLSASLTSRGILESKARVEVEGMSACPCTQELLRAYFRKPIGGRWLATHTQRCTGCLEVKAYGWKPPSYRMLAEIVEESMSSPTRALLKRRDEAALVASSLRNAKLAEDMVREILSRVMEALSEYPGDTEVYVEVKCLESVHKQDIIACRKATLADLRKELRV